MFEAKEIGFNGHCRIWIPRERYFEKFWYFWGKRDRSERSLLNMTIKREVFWKFWYFWGKRDRIKWLLSNL